jgi:hypothetical protein
MKQSLFLLISLSIFASAKSQKNATTVIKTTHHSTKEDRKLIFKIGNGQSRMPTIVVRSSTEASLVMNGFSNKDYKLQNFSITVLYNDSKTFKTSINQGSIFTEETRSILNLLRPNDMIVVYGISAINSKGDIVQIQERNFGVF